MRRWLIVGVVVLCGSVGWTVSRTLAYPNGPIWYVTDVAPYCAGCHASTSEKQIPEHPKEFVAKWTIEGKHLVDFEKGEAYKNMSPADKEKLLAVVKQVDSNASVKLEAPQTVKRGESLTVRVKARGGAGPTIGLALVDNDLRFQARPIGSTGFKIVKPAKIIGPDGKEQTKWHELRYKKLDDNLNFALVFGIHADPEHNRYDQAEVEWTLRAPTDPGTYTMAAAFFYGTEKASPIGTIEQFGQKLPKGGFLGHSGRVMFSDVHTITVQ